MSNFFNDMDDFNVREVINDDAEIVPIIQSEESDEEDNKTEIPEIIPILPLRNTVLFPGVIIPITVGRDKSIQLIKDAHKAKSVIGVISQKNAELDNPEAEDLNSIGTVAKIVKLLKLPGGNNTVIIQGVKRFELLEVVQTEPYIKAKVKQFATQRETNGDKEFEALIGSLKDLATRIITLSPSIPSEAGIAIKNIENSGFLVNFISSNMNAGVKEKQAMLEEADLKKRATLVLNQLSHELQMLELKNQIQTKVKVDLDKQQRDYFLNQQLKTIQEELGQDGPEVEIKELRDRGAKKKWPTEVAETFNKELDKMQRMNPAAAEYSVIMNYVELLLELPWNVYTKDNFDLKKARRILDRDHYGLGKVKERILEYLAVIKLKNDMKAPILCLVGAPGVGKTSLGKSVASAIGRKYVRIALGGVKDEADVRGHRKTYIGAMPGRIIQSLKKAKTSNPVFVLDEIDKIGNDFRGDPASALLEVLDPEQNTAFGDHYIEVDYDLSKVLFIATANSLNTIHPALRDRMEIIEMSGYTIEEKVEIAKKHLIPKQKENHGVEKVGLSFSKQVIEKIIEDYTRESGVRNLEQKIASVVRNFAKQVAMEEEFEKKISPDAVAKILGAPRFDKDMYQDLEQAGVVTGLAWTSVGGDILYIESILSPGNGRLHLTGNLGDVMKESANIAYTFLKANAKKFGIDNKHFHNWDIHIHVPAGAVPKDGPSAGITMLTALASLLTQRKVKGNIAMTGEITLRGKVLPVGGIKEKILAAKRAGIKEIILSSRNKNDVEEINNTYIKDLKFHYVDDMIDVVTIALKKQQVLNAVDLNRPNSPDSSTGIGYRSKTSTSQKPGFTPPN
ncbi:MAG: ATP-dependent Lon protease [Sphingobacteriales bacterium]|jgi:ATP-dependent Lon protease